MAGIKLYDLHETVYSFVLKSLSSGESPAGIIISLHSITDERVEEQVPQTEKAVMKCRRGCFHCCRVNVPVLAPEADVIAEYLKTILNTDELERLRAKLRYIKVNIAGYDDQERIVSNIPCGFLGEEGECIIHSVRPLVCRSVVSADDSACYNAMNMSIFEEYAYIPMNLKHKSIYDTAFLALADALKQSGGDSRSYEISEALLKRLTINI